MKHLIEQIEKYTPCDEREKGDKAAILDFAKKTPDRLCRENLIAHFATSPWIVNKSRTKVLMIYHNIYKSWSWAGGHADGESDLLAVCVREIAEETGLTDIKLLGDGIFGVNILTVEPHYKKGRYVNSHLHMDVEYLFEADDSLPLKIKEDENSAVGWIEVSRINEFVTEEKMKPVYARLVEKAKKY